jgi:hypothetical protein
MSTASVKTKLVLYAPRTTGAVQKLETLRSALPAAEVTDLQAVELEGPTAKSFDYNSKMQLKGQPLSFALFGCDGPAQTMGARQTLLKGAAGILLWPAAEDGLADVANLESALVGDFDLKAGTHYALGVVTDDAALAEATRAKGHFTVSASAEPQAQLKELMKAALKVAAAG